MAGIIATKGEMTRIIKEDRFIPVTLLHVPRGKIFGFKTQEIDGYEAVIVGVCKKDKEGILKEGRKTLSKNDFCFLKEFLYSKEQKEHWKVGDVIGIELLENISEVSIEGTSKGKGFTGAMKRHNFHGGPASHGSKFHRALGSIGNRKPKGTHKGKKMHGHHGDAKVSFRSVPVELVNKELGIIGVRGGIPGARNSIVNISFH